MQTVNTTDDVLMYSNIKNNQLARITEKDVRKILTDKKHNKYENLSAYQYILNKEDTKQGLLNILNEDIDKHNEITNNLNKGNRTMQEETVKENNIDLKLKKFIENIEYLESEKKEISEQISAIYKDAKYNGFNVKTIKKIIIIKKKDINELIEEEQLMTAYKEALGMSTQLKFELK